MPPKKRSKFSAEETEKNRMPCFKQLTPIQNKFVGAHVSGASGLENSFKNAFTINGRSFALFVKNQRKWDSPPYTEKQIGIFKETHQKYNICPSKIVPHGSYLINLGNPHEEKRKKSFESFIDDLKRCNQLGLTVYNFHPGSTVGECSTKQSIVNISKCINEAHNLVPNVCVVLETMAGQGNTIGNKFEELRDIIELINEKSRIGVCIDTCHIHAAGYDIRSEIAYKKTMDLFEQIIGFKYLRAVHLNDSKTPHGSGKDRHENIGKGHIGINAFRYLMNDSRFDNIPLILETPVLPGKTEEETYRDEIELLYSLID